jgi:hypothetical protein
MTEKGIISFKTGDILGAWLAENTWNFREPAAKWLNPQYKELDAILKDEKDPRTIFYNYIVKLRRQADANLPFGFRLDSRLPGVIKQNHERIDSGQGVASTIKGALTRELTFTVDDTTRTHEEIEDASGDPKYFLPIHYTGRITRDTVGESGETYREFDPDSQSFDIAGIYYKYWAMSNDYFEKSQIMPEMEFAKYMINKRRAKKLDPTGKIVMRKRSKRFGNDLPEQERTINNTLLAQQVNDWFLMCVYGQQEKDAGQLGKIDVSKLFDFINKYVSVNLLGVNFIAGTANIILGETLQRIETFAHEYMTPKDFLYADSFYLRTMKGMIGDVGARDTTGLGSLIIEQFGVLDDYGETDMSSRSKFAQLMKMDTLYFTSRLGEHYMQGRFLFGLLANKRAIDKDGKDIGRMLDFYEVKNGKLILSDKVDRDKSKWTDNDITDFKLKTRGILSRLHGEYGKLGKVAIQRMALGRMAYLFRHFIVPGFRRRWGKRSYIERLGQIVEGNYITTSKYIGSTIGSIFNKTEDNKELAFFSRLVDNIQSFKLSVFKEEWASLTDHEKANIQRTSYEVGFLLLAIVLANVAANFKGDDDDDELEDKFWAFMAYQMYRLQNELLFFTPKLDSAMSILRSPAASYSFLENLSDLIGQLFNPTEVYQSGPWKGRPKIIKTLNEMVPVTRQLYRLKNIDTQLPWMQRSAIGKKTKKEEEKVYSVQDL